MSTPGFTADRSLYRTTNYYSMYADAFTTTAGATTLLHSRHTLVTQHGGCPFKVANYDCTNCYRDASGNCTRDCECCEGINTKDNCVPIPPDPPCTPSDCCPVETDPCLSLAGNSFCCPPKTLCSDYGVCCPKGKSGCDVAGKFCCDVGEQCCDAANKVCCPFSEGECISGKCCPNVQAPGRPFVCTSVYPHQCCAIGETCTIDGCCGDPCPIAGESRCCAPGECTLDGCCPAEDVCADTTGKHCCSIYHPDSDIVCDSLGCISLSKFSANIASALDTKVVGYVFYVGGQKPTFGGQARTAADSPAAAMSFDLLTNVASISKTLTTVGVLQSLANHNLTIDDNISPYLYPDWNIGPNVDTITFRDLLTHTSGFRNNCDGSNTTYAVLKQQIADGVQLSNKRKSYNNCNFAIFRELLPFMEGSGPTGTDSQRADASATFYINYMKQHVFEPVGVSDASCTPPGAGGAIFPILSYPFPTGSANGTDWGDWKLSCGGGGWVLTAHDLMKVLDDLASGTVLLTSAQNR